MRVRELKKLIANLEEDTLVEFHDVTFEPKRDRPVNSARLVPASADAPPRLLLSNRIGE